MGMFDDLRSAWGARAPKNTPTYVDPLKRTEFFVHYDGGAAVVAPTHSDCLARVKQDQVFHMDKNGWSDIGYNALVCQHGRAIEGRGIDYVGAHCPDHNTTGYGFQFMVGGSQEPTPAAKSRMRKLYDDACDHSHRTLSKRGHRDGFATACPGDSIYAWVKAGMPAAAVAQEDDMADITEQNAKDLFTGFAILKDTRATNPDTAPRVAPSALIEYGADVSRDNAAAIKALGAKVDALAAKVTASGITQAQLEAALRTVLGSLDGK